jgi:signal transduction histidine kinase
LATGRAVRIDDYSELAEAVGFSVEDVPFVTAVGVPIVVDGTLWGAMCVGTSRAEHMPVDAETRLAGFTELVATAIANSDAQEKVERLAEEQAALRRVATLVAQGVQPAEIFSAVGREVGRVFGSQYAGVARFESDGSGVVIVGVGDGIRNIPIGTRWPLEDFLATTAVYRTGHPARNGMGDWVDTPGPVADSLRELGIVSTVASPIVVEGSVWGVITVSDTRRHLPLDAEERLAAFTDLVATAISDAESRAELAASEARARQLASEQAALRRVATLVAENASAEAVLGAVAEEAARVLAVPELTIDRFDRDGGATTVVASWCTETTFPVGSRWPLDGPSLAATIWETGRPARIDDYTGLPGTIAASLRDRPKIRGIGVPIVVGNRVWGMIGAGPMPDDAPEVVEQRLARFTELVVTAVANSEAHAQLEQVADEQAALRRVATFVARTAAPSEVFAAVAQEVAELLDADAAVVVRYEAGAAAWLGAYGVEDVLARGSASLGGENLSTLIYETGLPARIDRYSADDRGEVSAITRSLGLQSAVGAPIHVGGRLWGAVHVASRREAAFPSSTEEWLAAFADLVATAIANAQAREEVHTLADEQAALRRVATLVAQGASPDELFSAVAREVASVLDVAVVGINRYENDGTHTILGNAGESSSWIGTRWPVAREGLTGTILATGRPSRQDDFIGIHGALGDRVPDALIGSWRETRSVVGAPIVVEGSIWGILSATSAPGTLVPAGTEERLAHFTELVATAVLNATTRAELLASRSRLVSAADESRRRLERDLHDGIQQWLVALALRARKAAGLSEADESAARELSGLADDLVAVTDELREISRGIHPAILTDAGLDDALEALARRSAIRVDLDVNFRGRYDPAVEATVYYVAAESVTNAVKHAQASTVTVRGRRGDGEIELEIFDDGIGGADPQRGTGLIGLKDRVDTLGGTFSLSSSAGAGTTICLKLPVHPRGGETPPLPPSEEAAPRGSG